jgi:hypothetical protein
MREFRYPTAIPPLETRPIDPETGTWTYPWRVWLEGQQIQAGGQGGDAIYDAAISPFILAEENRDRIEAVERLVRSQDAQLQAALGALGDLARVDQANTRNIRNKAVSDIVAEALASGVLTDTNPKRSNSQTVTDDADLTNFENEATVLVSVDFEHSIDLGAYAWCVMRCDLLRRPLSGGGSAVLRSWRWVQAGDSSNSQFPAALETNNQTVTVPFSAIYADTLPAVGDADFDDTGYRYFVEIYVTDEWDDGSTMIDGYDSPSSTADHHSVEDLNIILTHLRR